VAVTTGGSTVNAPMYYTSASQIAALLPSSMATGTLAWLQARQRSRSPTTAR
jgi:uncharacterized protein (TIGR03437 family)